jgi:hypothetical protein
MLIMSSGGKRLDWFTKKSEDEMIGVDAITDDQLKGFAAPVTVDVSEAELGGTPESETIEVSDEVVEDIPGTPEDESLPSEGEGDLAGRVADLVDDVAAVQDKLQDIAEDAKEVGEIATGEGVGGIDEVEIEIEDVSDEAPVEDVVVEDVAVEDEAAEGALESETPGEVEKDDEALVVAGDTRTFAKFASLSADTKKKVQDYFSNVLGYDPEYVKLMVKEYK